MEIKVFFRAANEKKKWVLLKLIEIKTNLRSKDAVQRTVKEKQKSLYHHMLIESSSLFSALCSKKLVPPCVHMKHTQQHACIYSGNRVIYYHQ